MFLRCKVSYQRVHILKVVKLVNSNFENKRSESASLRLAVSSLSLQGDENSRAYRERQDSALADELTLTTKLGISFQNIGNLSIWVVAACPEA